MVTNTLSMEATGPWKIDLLTNLGIISSCYSPSELNIDRFDSCFGQEEASHLTVLITS